MYTTNDLKPKSALSAEILYSYLFLKFCYIINIKNLWCNLSIQEFHPNQSCFFLYFSLNFWFSDLFPYPDQNQLCYKPNSSFCQFLILQICLCLVSFSYVHLLLLCALKCIDQSLQNDRFHSLRILLLYKRKFFFLLLRPVLLY